MYVPILYSISSDEIFVFSSYFAFPFFAVNKSDHTLKFSWHCNHFAFLVPVTYNYWLKFLSF